MDENNVVCTQEEQRGTPGRGFALASMILGISSLCACCGWGVGIPPAIVGLIMASKARQKGFEGGFRKAGFTCSLIGLIAGIVILIVMIAVVVTAAVTGTSLLLNNMGDILDML